MNWWTNLILHMTGNAKGVVMCFYVRVAWLLIYGGHPQSTFPTL